MKKTNKTAPTDATEFDGVETGLLDYLDGLKKKDRLEKIDDLLHRLNFERRLTLLTPKQLDHMNNRDLSPVARARLDSAKNKEEREELITMYSRSQYFRDCAWGDYLNNGGTPPIVDK